MEWDVAETARNYIDSAQAWLGTPDSDCDGAPAGRRDRPSGSHKISVDRALARRGMTSHGGG